MFVTYWDIEIEDNNGNLDTVSVGFNGRDIDKLLYDPYETDDDTVNSIKLFVKHICKLGKNWSVKFNRKDLKEFVRYIEQEAC